MSSGGGGAGRRGRTGGGVDAARNAQGAFRGRMALRAAARQEVTGQVSSAIRIARGNGPYARTIGPQVVNQLRDGLQRGALTKSEAQSYLKQARSVGITIAPGTRF